MSTQETQETDEDLLVVDNLKTTFSTEAGELVAVDGIEFSVDRGETVCIVGESGSGKTVATESVTRLIKEPPGRIDGSIQFKGAELMEMSEPERHERMESLQASIREEDIHAWLSAQVDVLAGEERVAAADDD